MSKTILAVIIEGGMIQSVVSNDPAAFLDVDVIVIDYDAEGADRELVSGVPQSCGEVVEAIVHREDVDPSAIDLAAVCKGLS